MVFEISGLAGAGCRTMAAALADRFGVETVVDGVGDAPPDLMVRVIGAQVRARDRAAIEASSTPVIVVAGKADTRPEAHRQARVAAADLRRPVFPVSGLLATARIDASDVEQLRRWQRAGVRIPRAAADFAGGDPSQRDRARMMSGIGRAGLIAVFDVLATRPDASAVELVEILRARSGVDVLADPIAAAAGVIAEGRRTRRLFGLRLLAARGPDRAAVEQRLIAESLR